MYVLLFSHDVNNCFILRAKKTMYVLSHQMNSLMIHIAFMVNLSLMWKGNYHFWVVLLIRHKEIFLITETIYQREQLRSKPVEVIEW